MAAADLPPIRFLFRYRDFVAPTLSAHRKILDENKSVWWGWWKRPTEDARYVVWKALLDQLAVSTPVRIGLFDSGQEDPRKAVTCAWIDAVQPPPQSSDGSSLVALPSADDIKLVPEYYRSQPFSRAWMRFVSIETSPLDFFEEYSYASAPPLRRYRQETLDRLVGKKVMDPDELRGMDTTIWEVQPSLKEANSWHFLAAPLSIGKAHSADPIAARGPLILHISDPHLVSPDVFDAVKDRFDTYEKNHVWDLENHGSNTLAAAIGLALGDQKQDVGCIVVTGDLTVMANEAEFEEAKKFIGRLLGILDLGADQLVLIPGNHDLAWTNSKVYEDGAEVTEAPATAKSAYRAFYKKLLEHEAHDDLSMARRYVFPSGQVVEFCAVNSSSLEQGKNFLAGMGRVQERAFVAAAGELGWRKAEATRALRVLATHHHLTATEDLEDPDEYRKGFGMAIDAARIQRLAAEHKVHLIMHGHKHRTFLGFQGVYQLPEETRDRAFLGSISLLGGGSAGSPYQAGRAPAQPANYFNVLRVGATQLSASLYRGKARGVFEHFKTWGAPLSMDNEGNLQLGPWAPHSGS